MSVRFYGSESLEQVKLDIKYTSTMLTDKNFEVYVRNNDASSNHLSDDHPGMSSALIQDIMSRFHVNHYIECHAFMNAWHTDGFVVLMDDWENAWVYVGDNHSFDNWLQNAPHEGVSSFSFFEEVRAI